VLAVLVAVWAHIIGFFELFRAFSAGERVGERGLLGLTGLISVALGLVLAVQPDVGAVTIAEVFGLFSIVAGISSLVIGAKCAAPPPRLPADNITRRMSRIQPDVAAPRCPAGGSPGKVSRRATAHNRTR
jgi:Short repeat of unknown function (DUF308)